MTGPWADLGRHEPSTATRVWTGPVPTATAIPPMPRLPPMSGLPPVSRPAMPAGPPPRRPGRGPSRWALPMVLMALVAVVAAVVSVLAASSSAVGGTAVADPAQAVAPTTGSQPEIRPFPEPEVGGGALVGDDHDEADPTEKAADAGGAAGARRTAIAFVAAFNEQDGRTLRQLVCQSVRGSFTDRFIGEFDRGSFTLVAVVATGSEASMTIRYRHGGAPGTSNLRLIPDEGRWLVCG